MNAVNPAAKLRQVKQHLGLRHLVGLNPLGADDCLDQTLARLTVADQVSLFERAVDRSQDRPGGATRDNIVAVLLAWVILDSGQGVQRASMP
ncbi:hypothetical protein D3C85_1323750 [compost metagenome]